MKLLVAFATKFGLEVAYALAVTPDEIEGALVALVRDHARAILVEDGPLFTQERASIAAAALRYRLPTISNVPGFAEAGGLLQYGTDILDQFRRSAGYVDRILRGAKAGDLPIEQSTRIELAVNLKTARALGLTIPPAVSSRANRLIDP
jgi:putative ABC transport system substrate-binding protein